MLEIPDRLKARAEFFRRLGIEVIGFGFDGNAAADIGPAAVALGDEAFDAYGAMIFVRKGDKLVRIMYMECPCGPEDVVPLAQKIVAGL